MTNYQKLKKRYGSYLPSKARIIAAYGVITLSGDLKLCNEMDCKNCLFNEPINRTCGDVSDKWLDQEAEE